MKKLLFLVLLASLLNSCNLDSESYSKYIDWVDVTVNQVPDSAVAGQQILIHARASANSGCWSNLTLFLNRQVDTLYTINARGLFESHDGICPSVVVTADTIFKFTPDSAGLYVFVTQSVSKEAQYDTLIVTNTSAKAR